MLKNLYKITIIGSIACLCLTACKQEQKKVITPAKIEFKKEGNLTLYKSTTDSIITTLDIEIAETEYETQPGLMYRDAMQKHQGMLFIFPNMDYRSFYMKNTHIALDIIYLDADGYIVSFQKNAKPLDETSLPSEAPAQYVLEINSGLAEEWLLEVGDRMVFKKF
jgi:uncharacterized membrane protein (UPF0127 family)